MVEPAALAQLRRGVLEHCVLASLKDEPRYGYDLATSLAEVGLIASEGTIYPLLSRLRKDQLVETTWVESESGPPRRYYSLTPEGKQALAHFQPAWTHLKQTVDQLLGETS